MAQNPVFSLAFLPNIWWFANSIQFDRILIELNETYPKQTYRNRCEIAAVNGRQILTIPIKKQSGIKLKTSEIEISWTENWWGQHWHSIRSAYSSSPYFEYYADEIKQKLCQKSNNLVKYNTDFINLIFYLLDIETKISFTKEFQKTHKIDFRNNFKSISDYSKNYQDSFPIYKQVFSNKNKFEPNLSIIDLIFNEGPNSLSVLKKINGK